MNLVLFDDQQIRQSLLPLTFTRPVADMRVGILKISEKWEKLLNLSAFYATEEYLKVKFPLNLSNENLFINGALLPNEDIVAKIKNLAIGEILAKDKMILAFKCDEKSYQEALRGNFGNFKEVGFEGNADFIKEVWDIFLKNAGEIRRDFKLITTNRQSAGIDDKYTIVYNEQNIFVEEGVKIRAAILNAEDGPIYIGKNAQIQEGAIVKGPFALCEGSHLNMGAKMRGDSTIGPFSKVGGEISNSVIFGYSNKAHDGFIGNTVIGEWCNLGADTNTSNLKNNYANVKLWNYPKGGFKDTGLQFCGLIMGDHSKCGINTMFNTGTVVGVSANIFGDGFPRNFIPSFSWGGAAGFTTFDLKKAFEIAEKVMARRGLILDSTEKDILKYVFEETVKFREGK